MYFCVVIWFLATALIALFAGVSSTRQSFGVDFQYEECKKSQSGIVSSDLLPAPVDEFPCATTLNAGTCSTNGESCLPKFMIIGAMKSGTGVMMEVLNQHPNALSGKGVHNKNEVQFFGTKQVVDTTCRNKDYAKHFSLMHYSMSTKSSKMEVNQNNQLVWFDKSPSYIRSDSAMNQINRMLKGVKLIILLRQPSIRAYSGFQHNCRHGRIAYSQSLDITINLESSVARLDDFVDKHGKITSKAKVHKLNPLSYPCTPDQFHHYISKKNIKYSEEELSIGNYADQLDLILRIFPLSDIKIIFQETMLLDTIDAVRSVEAFVGLPCYHGYKKKGKAFRKHSHSFAKMIIPERFWSMAKSPDEVHSDSIQLLNQYYSEQNKKLEVLLKEHFHMKIPWNEYYHNANTNFNNNIDQKALEMIKKKLRIGIDR